MSEEPTTLGNGLGATLADFIPLLPSGARRSGAARIMAERIDEKPSWLLRNPILSQLLAMAGGGTAAALVAENQPESKLRDAAIGLLPLALVQSMRHSEIKEIDNKYTDTKKRKRLAEIDGEAQNDWGGSSRLGATRAFEQMRQRKRIDMSATTEAMDALPLALTPVLGPAAGLLSLPVTHVNDMLEARRIKKEASAFDQDNVPVIGATALSALLGIAGQVGAHSLLTDGIAGDARLPRHEARSLLRHVSGRDPMLAQLNIDNSFFAQPRTAEEAEGLSALAVASDPTTFLESRPLRAGYMERIRDRAMRNGVIGVGKGAFGSPQIVAHEGGHARIEETPGVVRALQRHLYPLARLTAPLTSVGALAARLKSESAIKGGLLGTLIGAVGNAGIMVPEFMASYHGLKGLRSHQGGRLSQAGDTADLIRALGTYAAGTVLPSTISGALGGYIGGRRKEASTAREAYVARMLGQPLPPQALPQPEGLSAGQSALVGSGLASALPLAAHGRYELVDAPRYEKNIHRYVDQAQRDGTLHLSKVDWDADNPLQRGLRAGDIALQSHSGRPLMESLRNGSKWDFTTLSLAGSGSPFSHAAMAASNGLGIDAGDPTAHTFKSRAMELLRSPDRADLDKWKALFAARGKDPLKTFLSTTGSDLIGGGDSRPNVSILLRPENRSGIGVDDLERHMAEVKGVGYSREDAALAGLKRLIFPWRSGSKQRQAASLTDGSFCSHGACSLTSMLGLDTPDPRRTLPPDLAEVKGMHLNGVGVNAAALKDAVRVGLSESDLAGAAKRTMLNTLRSAKGSRRGLAALVAGGAATAGAMGGLIGNAFAGD